MSGELREAYDKAGQGHVFRFWDELSQGERASFEEQLASLTRPERVNAIYSAATKADASTASLELSPPRPQDVASSTASSSSEWRGRGLEAIERGQVGVLLMAGGQGTRLGSSAPKGCYDIGLPSHKSLFQIQAERIASLASLASQKSTKSARIPWYIMTSGPTRKATEQTFQEHDYFGLDRRDVIFFEQGVLPCLSKDGKILLDSKSSVAVAPDGNGGLYPALRKPLEPHGKSVLQDIEARGVKYLHAYCVDNCLVRVADPIFLGCCIESNADCGVKVVKKTNPAESVGVVALKDGKYNVVEYSEIPRELSEQRDGGDEQQTGDLTYRAANIANHFYTLDFLKRVESFEHEMPHHVASKKIAHVDLDTGSLVKPDKPNGIKLEQFVFDVFPFVERMAILEVDRATDFSPLKNAPGTGSDDPETSRRDLLADQRKWLVDAGVTVDDGVEVEVSPLVSYAGEGLDSLKGKHVTQSGILNSLADIDKLA